MKKIIAFGASNSQNSINKKLAQYAANQFKNVEIEILDLNDFEMPIYSIDREKSNGIPEQAKNFTDKLGTADLLIISFAEYNGAYTSAFKNIFDWASRVVNKTFQEKPTLLMSTATGPRGGATVLEIAKNRFPHQGANVVGSFILPSFNANFQENDIVNEELKNQLLDIVKGIEF
jgi:chromate reductase, NAD(P)H dehydrogenase (quinone)